MHGPTLRALVSLSIAAAFAWTPGCRLATDNFDESDGSNFDAGSDDDAGPGAVCPPDSPDLFNNTFSPYMGGESSVDLEVVDFSFFKCPHCADFAQRWEEIWANRPDIRARVRLYFHHFPFDFQSAWDVHATTVAAANQGMDNFWQLHDYIFDGLYNDGHQYTLDEIRAYCTDVLQLEMTQFEEDLADPYTREFLGWDKEQAQAAGVTGTPSVFVCGQKISWSELESVIDGYIN